MACPGKCFPKELILQPSDFAKSLVFKRDFDFLKMFTAVVRRPAPSAGAFQSGVQQTTAQHQNLRVGLVQFYSSRLRKRSAFTMTETELKVMARLAIIGLKRIPNQG
jgi:hypothetical protein